jgi:hypothetical protein
MICITYGKKASGQMVESPSENQAVGRARRTVTLVGGLLTLLLLGLLVALLSVAVWTAQGAADRTACTAQLRQLASALAMYKSDCGDYPPLVHVTHDENNRIIHKVTWQEMLSPYVADPHIFRCPSGPEVSRAAEGRPEGLPGDLLATSYAYVGGKPRVLVRAAARGLAPFPAGGPEGSDKPPQNGILLVCKHHDDASAGQHRWVLVAYEDGSVEWEVMPRLFPRPRERRSRGTGRVSRPGSNDR